eukprot:CAMPEP_0171241642 /NCGR_PEP_ID=MMETSP0790-20130122/45203_1 /TAXON_ID=2925 /ORGANISM="Alexandrium catenella, Strain OF101" /LENGTH=45 /DNA_ID= /DNA_START= /DNA_END= /DNA_ORIENTATION=
MTRLGALPVVRVKSAPPEDACEVASSIDLDASACCRGLRAAPGPP